MRLTSIKKVCAAPESVKALPRFINNGLPVDADASAAVSVPCSDHYLDTCLTLISEMQAARKTAALAAVGAEAQKRTKDPFCF